MTESREKPKIVVGFSDVTALLAALYSRCGLVTFHGPVVAGLPGVDAQSLAALMSAIAGPAPVDISAPHGETVCPGSGTGPVLAGNLTTLCHLIGTPYMPPTQGHLLLLEIVAKPLTGSTECSASCGWPDALRRLPAWRSDPSAIAASPMNYRELSKIISPTSGFRF